MRRALLSVLAALALIIGSVGPTLAEGNHFGFSDDSGQGNLDNDNDNANPDNKGQVEVSGPKGQIDKGNTDCNNCESSGPGNSQH
jgi:hypothetical protein